MSNKILLRKDRDQLIITHFYHEVDNKDLTEEELQERVSETIKDGEWHRLVSSLPEDPFSDAWEFNEEASDVVVNLDKAKELVHATRRSQREKEFFPWDMKIAAQIPGEAESAESERVKIRKKYHKIQKEIDLSENTGQLQNKLNKLLRSE